MHTQARVTLRKRCTRTAPWSAPPTLTHPCAAEATNRQVSSHDAVAGNDGRKRVAPHALRSDRVRARRRCVHRLVRPMRAESQEHTGIKPAIASVTEPAPACTKLANRQLTQAGTQGGRRLAVRTWPTARAELRSTCAIAPYVLTFPRGIRLHNCAGQAATEAVKGCIQRWGLQPLLQAPSR